MRLTWTIITLLVFGTAPPSLAQAPEDVGGTWIFLAEGRERWLHERQDPRFTAYAPINRTIRASPVAPGTDVPGYREVRVFAPLERNAARIRVDSLGRVAGVAAIPQGAPRSSAGPEGRFVGGIRALRLPHSISWEVIPLLGRTGIRTGDEWTDTLDLVTEQGGSRQTLYGPRVRSVVGDTLIDGRRHWIVRDSTQATYTERWTHDPPWPSASAVVERTAAGVLLGRSVFDPESGVARTRVDRAVLNGEATLVDEEGRRLTTAAQYERTTTWTLHDPESLARRGVEIFDETGARRTGMMRLPVTGEERRLAGGDMALRDSLIDRWSREQDPDAIAKLRAQLAHWQRDGSRAWQDTLDALQLAHGDTAGTILRIMREAAFGANGLSPEDVQLLLPVLRDPGLAFALWIDRDHLFESIRRALLATPPAVMVDSSFQASTVEACRMLAALADSAAEPRLRDLGLIARLALEPARWDAAVLQRVADGAPFLEPAAALIRGDRPTGEVSLLRLPPPDASANAWLAWLSGTPLLSRNDASILRFVQARGERDLVGELRRLRAGDVDAPPQLAVEALLVGLRAEELDADVVAARLRVADPGLREHAMRQMQDLLRAAPRAPPEVARELSDRLLGIVMHGADAWPPSIPSSAPRPQTPPLPTGSEKVYMVADDLLPAVRARWEGELDLVPVQRLAAPDGTLLPGCHMRIRGPVQIGPFARVSASCTLVVIDEGGRPAGYGASVMYDLMREGEGWVAVLALHTVT